MCRCGSMTNCVTPHHPLVILVVRHLYMAFAQSQKRSFLFIILGVLLFYKVYIVASFSAPLPQSFDIVCANTEIVRTVLLQRFRIHKAEFWQ